MRNMLHLRQSIIGENFTSSCSVWVDFRAHCFAPFAIQLLVANQIVATLDKPPEPASTAHKHVPILLHIGACCGLHEIKPENDIKNIYQDFSRDYTSSACEVLQWDFCEI